MAVKEFSPFAGQDQIEAAVAVTMKTVLLVGPSAQLCEEVEDERDVIALGQVIRMTGPTARRVPSGCTSNMRFGPRAWYLSPDQARVLVTVSVSPSTT